MEKESENILNVALNELVKIAVTDGLITKEEVDLLRQIEIDKGKYQEMLDLALEDGIITDEEKDGLKKTKEMIINRAVILAKEDDIISKDELQLLKTLAKILKVHLKTD